MFNTLQCGHEAQKGKAPLAQTGETLISIIEREGLPDERDLAVVVEPVLVPGSPVGNKRNLGAPPRFTSCDNRQSSSVNQIPSVALKRRLQ